MTGFETTFWKVHNKYLFQLIFQFIGDVECAQYKFHNVNKQNARIKFKNIHSLEWMIVNKQYELLKCKLLHCEKLSKSTLSNIYTGDDFIDVTDSGMCHLFELGCDSNNEPIEKQKEDRIILLGLLPLVLNIKKLEIVNMDLPSFAIHSNNSTALQILLNEPYFLSVTPRTLENAIREKSPLIVSLIINSMVNNRNIVISPQTIEKSIQLAFSNIGKDEMVQLILDNQQLYSAKSLDKIEFDSLLNLKSSKLQNQLMDIHFIKKKKKNKMLTKHIGTIDKLLEIKSNGGEIDMVKEIYKLLVIESSDKYYHGYLSRYDEPIDGVDIMAVINHCLSQYSVKSLSYLISNENAIDYLNKNQMKIKEIKKSSLNLLSKPTYKEFIVLYISNIGTFNNIQCSSTIDSYIFNVKSSQEYESIVNERYPLKWNSILSTLSSSYEGGFLISDKETIDYLVEFKSNQFIQEIVGQLNIYKFDSCQLMEYAMKSFYYILKLNYTDVFICAIYDCDVDTLTHIYNGNFITSEINVPSRYQVKNFMEVSIENLNKLFNFLHCINYKMISENLISMVIDSLCLRSGKSLEEVNQLSIPSLPFTRYITESALELINFFNLNKIQLILNTFNPIKTGIPSLALFKEDLNRLVPYRTFNSDREIEFRNYIPNEQTVAKSIEIILNNYLKECSTTDISIVVVEIYTMIINHLFKCLISIRNVKLDTISKVLHLVNTTNENINGNTNAQQQQRRQDFSMGIIIEQSFYHSFFYICSKSLKFQKYLMELPFIASVLTEYREYYYNVDHHNGYNGYNIANYLDTSIFTFDYIFNSSFDDVLNALMYHLSILPAFNDQEMVTMEMEYYNKSLNSNLLYLLEIKRTDLFFNQLDYIQQQLNDTTIVIGNFPTIINEKENNNTGTQIDTGGNFELYQQTITAGRILKFTIQLFNMACKVFSNLESEFQKFISFCSYYSIVDCLEDINKIYINDHFLKKFNQFQSIFNTRRTNTTVGNKRQLFDNVKSIRDHNIPIEYGLAYGHGGGCEFTGITLNHLIKYQNYFISGTKLTSTDKLNQILINAIDSSIRFNIVLCEIISKSLNIQNQPSYFTFTKSTIDNAIGYGCIGFLKYYCDNGVINNSNNNGEGDLLKYLQKELSDSVHKHSIWFKSLKLNK